MFVFLAVFDCHVCKFAIGLRVARRDATLPIEMNRLPPNGSRLARRPPAKRRRRMLRAHAPPPPFDHLWRCVAAAVALLAAPTTATTTQTRAQTQTRTPQTKARNSLVAVAAAQVSDAAAHAK